MIYDIDTVDNVAKEVIAALSEYGAPKDLAILALCRSIVLIGTQQDLDVACRLIDEFSEMPFDPVEVEL